MPVELPPPSFDSPQPISPSASVAIPAFLARVYAWMAAGLMTTAFAAFLTVSNPAVFNAVFGNRLVFYGLLFAELGLVVWLSGLVGKLSSGAASTVKQKLPPGRSGAVDGTARKVSTSGPCLGRRMASV